jgi:hypothetical protein
VVTQSELEAMARIQERIEADGRSLEARMRQVEARLQAGAPMEPGRFAFNGVAKRVDGPRGWSQDRMPRGT